MRPLTAQIGWLRYCVFDTALGPVGLVWSERGLIRLQLPEDDRRATERRLRGNANNIAETKPDAEIGGVVASLQRYMAGERIDFSRVKLDLTGIGAFHRSIYESTRAVAWGKTTTYGALAKLAGSLEAARAVGQAMGRNPVPIIIPCHRVLASGGKIGGFSAFGGAVTKARLLAMEGVVLDDGAPLLPGLLDGPDTERRPLTARTQRGRNPGRVHRADNIG